MNHAFDSDELAPCQCGSPTLFIQFLPSGDWVISCTCGHYWPLKELWSPHGLRGPAGSSGAQAVLLPSGEIVGGALTAVNAEMLLKGGPSER